MKVAVGRRRQGINRHEDSLSTVERAKHLFAELWTRGDIAIVSTEASTGSLRLLLRSCFQAEEFVSRQAQSIN